MICSKCGRILKDDDVFCSTCGTRVEKPKDTSSSNTNIDRTTTGEFHVDEIQWDLNGFPKEEVKRRETTTLDWSMVVDERDRRIAEMNAEAWREEPVDSIPEGNAEDLAADDFDDSLAMKEYLVKEREIEARATEKNGPEEEIIIENFADIEAPSVTFVPEFKKEKSHTMEIIEEPAPEHKPMIKEVSLEEVFEGVEPPKEDDWKKDATVRMSMDRKKAMRNKKPAKFTHGESIFHTARGMDEMAEEEESKGLSVADDVRDIVPPLNKAGSIFYTGQDNEEIGAATQLHIPRDTSYEGTNTFVSERKDIADAIQDVSVDRNEFTEEDTPYVSRDTYDDLDDIEDTPRQRFLGGIMGWGDKIKSLGSRLGDDEDFDDYDDDDDDRPSRREYDESDDYDDDDDDFDDKVKSKFRSFLDKITGLDVERERAEETGYNRFARERDAIEETRPSKDEAEDMFLAESEREAISSEPRNQRAHISPVRPAVKAGVVTAGISRNTAVQDFQKDIAEASAGGITHPVEKKRNPDDKFYTFNQKSEEFRALLDEEYERLRQRIKDESEPGIGAELEARMNSYVPRRERIKEQEEALDIQELDEEAAVSEAPAAEPIEEAVAEEATAEAVEDAVEEATAEEVVDAAEEVAAEEVAGIEEEMMETAPEEVTEAAPVDAPEAIEVQAEEATATETETGEESVAEVEEVAEPIIEEEEEEEEEFIWTDVPDEDIDVELASATTDEVEPEEDEVVVVNDISQIIPESLDDENLTQTGRRRARRTLLQDIFSGNEPATSEEPEEDNYNHIVSEETEKELMDFERRIDQMESEFESETGIERKKIPATRRPHTFAPAIPTGVVDAEERIRRTAMGTPSTEENVGTDDQIPEHVNKAPENKVQSVKARESEKPVVYAGPVKKEKNLYKEEPQRNTKAIALDVLIALLLIGIILVSILVFGRNTAVGQKLQEILGLKAEEVVEEVVPESVTEPAVQEPVLSAIESAIKETKDRNTGIGDVAEDTALKFDPDAYYGFDGLIDAVDFTDKDWYSTDDGNVVKVTPALVGAAEEYYSKLLDRMNTGSDAILDFLDDTTTAYWNAAEYGPEDGVTYEFPKLQIGEIRQNGDIYYMLVRIAQKSNVEENLSTKLQVMQFDTEYHELSILNVLDVVDDEETEDTEVVEDVETTEAEEYVEPEEEATYVESEEETTYVDDTETTEDGE